MPDDIPKHRAAIDALEKKIAALLKSARRRAARHRQAEGERRRLPPRARGRGSAQDRGRQFAGRSRTGCARPAFVTEIIPLPRARAAASVATSGPQGTFSEMALGKQFGRAVAAQPWGASLDEVFPRRRNGTAQYASSR